MNNQVVLITGINGFIGRGLFKAIYKRYPDSKIVGIDKKENNFGFSTHNFDLLNNDYLDDFLLKINPSYIFHLAGMLHSNSFATLFNYNVLSTIRIVDAVKLKKLETRIVLIGSAAEYGRIPLCKLPASEDDVLNPIGPYGVSKAWQTIAMNYYSNIGCNIVLARIFNVIGKEASENQAIGAFARQLRLIKTKNVPSALSVGNLKSKRDYLDLEDVCNGLISVATKGRIGNAYNICSGESISMEDLLKKMIKYLKLDIDIVQDSSKFQQADIENIYGSNKKIILDTSWRQTITITESIKSLFEDLQTKI